MKNLRVLILCEGHVVDARELDDPRQQFVAEFNQLNEGTGFEAVLAELTSGRSEAIDRRCSAGRQARHCSATIR